MFLLILVTLLSLSVASDKYYATNQVIGYDGYWGGWGEAQTCQSGYATRFKIQVESAQGRRDDTGMNSICLTCSGNNNEICSRKGYWGSWYSSSYCSSGFDGMNLKIEHPVGGKDDTAANNLALVCSATSRDVLTSSPSGWGIWEGNKYCRDGAKICGIQTRVESKQGGFINDDDTALNGVKFQCCAKVIDVKVRLVAIFEIEGGSGSGSSFVQTKTYQVGLLTSTRYEKKTSFQIATDVLSEVNYTGAAAAAKASDSVSTNSLESTFSSALSTREEKRTETSTWTVSFSDPLYVYQGQSEIRMSDGSSITLGGTHLIQSSKPLETVSYSVLS